MRRTRIASLRSKNPITVKIVANTVKKKNTLGFLIMAPNAPLTTGERIRSSFYHFLHHYTFCINWNKRPTVANRSNAAESSRQRTNHFQMFRCKPFERTRARQLALKTCHGKTLLYKKKSNKFESIEILYITVVLLVSVSHSVHWLEPKWLRSYLEDTMMASCAARMWDVFARAWATIKILNDIANDEKQPFVVFSQTYQVFLFFFISFRALAFAFK